MTLDDDTLKHADCSRSSPIADETVSIKFEYVMKTKDMIREWQAIDLDHLPISTTFATLVLVIESDIDERARSSSRLRDIKEHIDYELRIRNTATGIWDRMRSGMTLERFIDPKTRRGPPSRETRGLIDQLHPDWDQSTYQLMGKIVLFLSRGLETFRTLEEAQAELLPPSNEAELANTFSHIIDLTGDDEDLIKRENRIEREETTSNQQSPTKADMPTPGNTPASEIPVAVGKSPLASRCNEKSQTPVRSNRQEVIEPSATAVTPAVFKAPTAIMTPTAVKMPIATKISTAVKASTPTKSSGKPHTPRTTTGLESSSTASASKAFETSRAPVTGKSSSANNTPTSHKAQDTTKPSSAGGGGYLKPRSLSLGSPLARKLPATTSRLEVGGANMGAPVNRHGYNIDSAGKVRVPSPT